MVLTEREILNLALETLREKCITQKTVILKEDNTHKNFERLFKS